MITRRRLAVGAAAAALAIVAVPHSAAAWTGDAYADGFVQATDGTGAASGAVDADPDGNVELSASSVGGTAFLVPILNLLPYSTPTTVYSQAYVSDGVEGFDGVEAGHEYRVTVYYSDLDVESSATRNGHATAQVWAQASAGSDGAGHTLIVGSAAEAVTEDGTAVLEFDVHATQDSPLGVQAGIQIQTSASGNGNEASAELSGAVTDVEVVEIG